VITYVQLMDTGVHGPRSIEFCLELAYVLVKRCTCTRSGSGTGWSHENENSKNVRDGAGAHWSSNERAERRLVSIRMTCIYTRLVDAWSRHARQPLAS
jgi:hypothetical protein